MAGLGQLAAKEAQRVSLQRQAQGGVILRDLFAADPQRFERMSVEAAGLFLDYSKNRLDGRTLELLAALAREQVQRHAGGDEAEESDTHISRKVGEN